MYCLDIETLDVESTAVVLSVSIIPFEFDKVIPDHELTPEKMIEIYNNYRNNSITVKFDINDQINIGRTIDEETTLWWRKQSKIAQRGSLIPQTTDLSAKDGIDLLRDYIQHNGGETQIVWVRGSLDQMALESLCRSLKVPPLIHYRYFRDIRTAIELIAEKSNSGYCNIKGGFVQNEQVIKHVPVNDCALDIMMMLYHE